VPDGASVTALVARAAAGDPSAWAEIVERYTPLLWAICRRYGLSDASAQDVGATVWLRLVERLGALREPAALPGWLATTTRNECLSVLRKGARQVPTEHDDMVLDDEPDTEHWLLLQERYVTLRQAFADLGERCKALLRLVFADPPIPYADIADRMGMPVGSVGPTRGRCLDTLRRHPTITDLLGETGDDPRPGGGEP
jgi:RNA polymerase sigma factor (sigma-70 family)